VIQWEINLQICHFLHKIEGPIVFTELGGEGAKIKECVKEREHHPLYHDLEISRYRNM